LHLHAYLSVSNLPLTAVEETNMAIANFISGDGQTSQGQEVVIPICTVDEHNRIECIGTGFFISVYGIFATAAHVVKDILDKDGNPPVDADGNSTVGLMTFHFIPPNTIALREINKISFHNRDDVAVGTVKNIVDQKTGEPLRNKCLPLTARVPEVG